jgi:RecG-like helicase
VGERLSLLRRLTASAHHLDAADLKSDVERLHCCPLSTVARGDHATVTGRIRSVVYNPREHVPTLEAQLFDGSGVLELVWLGRRRITGIEPGRRLTVSGRVGEHDGRLAIYNPRYELHPSAAPT